MVKLSTPHDHTGIDLQCRFQIFQNGRNFSRRRSPAGVGATCRNCPIEQVSAQTVFHRSNHLARRRGSHPKLDGLRCSATAANSAHSANCTLRIFWTHLPGSPRPRNDGAYRAASRTAIAWVAPSDGADPVADTAPTIACRIRVFSRWVRAQDADMAVTPRRFIQGSEGGGNSETSQGLSLLAAAGSFAAVKLASRSGTLFVTDGELKVALHY
jgi:hypothetical protein